MKSAFKRFFLVAMLAVVFSGLGPQVTSALAQTGTWEYSDTWRGWLDWDTGLVWSAEGLGFNTWPLAVDSAARHSAIDGVPWRLPTVAECQLAAANGICAAVPNTALGRYCWTADAKGKGNAATAKSHYAIIFLTGTVNLYINDSGIDRIFVYRLFTP